MKWNNHNKSDKKSKVFVVKLSQLLQIMLILILISFIVLVFYSPVPSNIILNRNANHNELLQIRKQEMHQGNKSVPIAIKIEESTTTFPIYKSAGSYHVITYIGSASNPSRLQKQVLILDTGSHYMAFPCDPCLSCGKHASNKYYDPALSATNQITTCDSNDDGCSMDASICTSDNLCQLTVRYTEGSSWTAYEHTDNVWIGSKSDNNVSGLTNHKKYSAPVTFGCQFYESGLFRTQHEDGILGLAMNPDTMLTAIYKNHGSIQHNSFSICLNGQNHHHKNIQEEKGHLTLGGIHPNIHHDHNMQFTNLIDNPNGWYVIQINSVFIGTLSLSHSSSIFRENNQQRIMNSFNSKERGTIVDSGTTDIYLPAGIASTFIPIWEHYTKIPFTNTPMELSWEELSNVPNVTLVLEGGYQWVLQPKYYLEPFVTINSNKDDVNDMSSLISSKWAGKRTFINRIYLDEPNGAVLGISAMLGHDIYFDIESRRVGFSTSDCNI